MKKKYLFGFLGLFALGFVLAGGYVYHNFTIKSDVYEPFAIEYAIIGDASNWDGLSTCQDYAGTWTAYENGFELDVQGLYAGEGRLICARINNLAEADIPFTISNTIANVDEATKALCISAFGENTLTGTAAKQTQTIAEFPVVISELAQPVADCLIKIEASRG